MSDLFGDYDIDTMNEMDVRELIVRPLLHQLGYRQGTEANIETEKVLRYKKIFLGRKNPDKDPDLVGRADYTCKVLSYAGWVVEVKSPKHDLDVEDAYQAHTVLFFGQRCQASFTALPCTLVFPISSCINMAMHVQGQQYDWGYMFFSII